MSNNLLEITRFGNPILRQKARELSLEEVRSDETQQLIADIRYTNTIKEYGVGLAAPQVGVSVALSVIGIKPTPNHPDLEYFDSVIINPAYDGIGRLSGKWEGCQSGGTGDDIMFGKSMRYEKIRAKYYDENGKYHDEVLNGFSAHVFQHEADHLSGILFVDKVKDTKTFMMADEYRKRIVNKLKRNAIKDLLQIRCNKHT
jgi:peptide deformylase